MPVFSGTFSTASLAEILRMLVNTRQTGYLEMDEDGKVGFIALEKGLIINAETTPFTGLHALYQFIVWRHASFEFQEKPLDPALRRELAAYDPQVLVAGVTTKVDELAALQQAIPSLDSVLYYVGGEALSSVDATPGDLGLLILADGNRSVRDIAHQVKLSPLEVAHNLVRFRLAGVLELVQKKRNERPAAAAGAR
jgi:hypothetical protein